MFRYVELSVLLQLGLIMSRTVVMLVHVVHVGSGSCPLSLPVYEFIRAGESLEIQDMMVIVQSTHMGTALGVQWEERLEN